MTTEHNRCFIAGVILEKVKNCNNLVVKGGFLRDGGHGAGGGSWAGSSSDIDIEIVSIGFPKMFNIRNEFIEEVSKKLTLVSQNHVKEDLLHGTYCGDLYRVVFSHDKTPVTVDICFKPFWELDFDVNSLVFGGDKISFSNSTNPKNVMSHIKNKQFRVMWNPIWKKTKQLQIIRNRIKKMENRDWKCLNPK